MMENEAMEQLATSGAEFPDAGAGSRTRDTAERKPPNDADRFSHLEPSQCFQKYCLYIHNFELSLLF